MPKKTIAEEFGLDPETLHPEESYPAPSIASEQKPAIWIQSNHIDNAKNGAFLSRTGPFKMQSDWAPLFTGPPNTADIEQRVAEACAALCGTRAQQIPFNQQVRKDEAQGCEAEILSGKWREYR